jgi:hypothetical protein
MLVLGLITGFISGYFLGSKAMFFVLLGRTLPYTMIWTNSWHKTFPVTLLVNNIEFICINNIFSIGFNPRVLVLN